MTTWERIAEKAKALPPEKQDEALDFLEFLHTRARMKVPLQDPAGLLESLRTDLTEENVAEARREMWGVFPRKDL